MKNKIWWVIISCLMVLSLVLASCGPVEEEKKEVVAEEEEEETKEEEEEEVVAPEDNTPKYGGTLTVVERQAILGFDRGAIGTSAGGPWRVINEGLANPDWSRGPAGTGEVDWALTNTMATPGWDQGDLAESWVFPEPGNIVMQVRQGVHWALDQTSEASRLVGGREFTADDMVSGLDWGVRNSTGFIATHEPKLATELEITKTGPWEVTLKCDPVDNPILWKALFSSTIAVGIVAPEVIAKYGDQNDWRNVVGTGPFMITDNIEGSSLTMVRNPNYWKTDPCGLGEGNQLPYVDGVKYLVISDVATQMAAMRTAKVDWIPEVYWEDALALMEEEPDIHGLGCVTQLPFNINMRQDQKDLPMGDVKVRQAMHMAIDFESIKNDYLLGQAKYPVYPQMPPTILGYCPYVPLEDLPESVQELFSYNPEKARQLLNEAGYPTGFETFIYTRSEPMYVDMLSLVKDMWDDVGIDLEIKPLDYAVWSSRYRARNYEELLFCAGYAFTAWVDMTMYSGIGVANNYSYVDDPKVYAVKEEISPYALTNPQLAIEKLEELQPYVMEQCWVIGLPAPYVYHLWWPWVKNYHGELGVVVGSRTGWTKYVWLDQDLKKTMTGK